MYRLRIITSQLACFSKFSGGVGRGRARRGWVGRLVIVLWRVMVITSECLLIVNGAFSACTRRTTMWVLGRTRSPYFVTPGASLPFNRCFVASYALGIWHIWKFTHFYLCSAFFTHFLFDNEQPQCSLPSLSPPVNGLAHTRLGPMHWAKPLERREQCPSQTHGPL